MARPEVRLPAGPARGFTLLEVLVALVIFGLAFGVLAQILQTGLRQSARAEALATATLLGRSQLARVGAEVPLIPGEIEEQVNGDYRIRTIVQPAALEPADQQLVPYVIQVAVRWGPLGREQEVALTTLRLGAAPPDEDGP